MCLFYNQWHFRFNKIWYIYLSMINLTSMIYIKVLFLKMKLQILFEIHNKLHTYQLFLRIKMFQIFTKFCNLHASSKIHKTFYQIGFKKNCWTYMETTNGMPNNKKFITNIYYAFWQLFRLSYTKTFIFNLSTYYFKIPINLESLQAGPHMSL